MSKLVFEIFTEEVPATLQGKIVLDYVDFAKEKLDDVGVVLKSEVFVGITPNRMVLFLDDCVCNLQQLKEFIQITLKEFSKMFIRTMRYPQLETRWIRPIRGIFACIDDAVIEDVFFGIEANKGTYVDKFNFVECKNVDEYFLTLKQSGIVLDYFERLEFVKKEIYNFISGKMYHADDKIISFEEYWHGEGKTKYLKLAEEIAGMGEYCVKPIESLLGREFYILPFELIELVLRENQRYVVLPKDLNGDIRFLIFGDKITEKEDRRREITKGHQKVVKARLEDAIYYWRIDGDEKNKLGNEYKISLCKRLFARTFVDELTWGDYLTQQSELAKQIVLNDALLDKVSKLLIDTKLDLSTSVVAEFPELQGIIGGYYFNYNFNPYLLDNGRLDKLDAEVLYFYIIDRLTYIFIMYEHNKKPTGSGDKYKVKARMDDVVKIFDKNKGILQCNEIFKNDDIRSLFIKRYCKYIEDMYKDTTNIKKIAEIYVKCAINNATIDIQRVMDTLNNAGFMKTYKRIDGYANGVVVKETQEILQKVKDVFKDENIDSLNNYLDNHKIADDKVVLMALAIIETKYFESKLPKAFLEII